MNDESSEMEDKTGNRQQTRRRRFPPEQERGNWCFCSLDCTTAAVTRAMRGSKRRLVESKQAGRRVYVSFKCDCWVVGGIEHVTCAPF
jgi:hypothetical protein